MSSCTYFGSEEWARLHEQTVERVAAQDGMNETVARHQLPDPPEDCGRAVIENGRCVFHQPSGTEVKEQPSKALLDAITETEGEISIYGLRASELDLSQFKIGTELEPPVRLPYARVGDLSLEKANVGPLIDLTGADVENLTLKDTTLLDGLTTSYMLVRGVTDLTEATLHGPWVSIRSRHRERCKLDFAQFNRRRTKLSNARFKGTFSADRAQFDDMLVCPGTQFDGGARFSETKFDRVNMKSAGFADISLRDAIVDRLFKFADVTVRDDLSVYDSVFRGRADFSDTTVRGDAKLRKNRLKDEANFEEVRFGGHACFDRTRFHERVSLSGATVSSGASFQKTGFEVSLEADGLQTDGLLDFRHATLADGFVNTGKSVFIDCSRATLGTVEFQREAKHSLEDVALTGTEYDGFDFARYTDSLEPDWSLRTEGDGDDDEVPGWETYLRAKNAAGDAGNVTAAAEFFLREMRCRRRAHARRVRTSGRPRERLAAGARWLKNAAFDLSCGYGERPGNTVALSVAVVCLYAPVLATMLDRSLTTGLVLSIQTFIAFLFGGVSENPDRFVELVAASEAFLGAFAVALFVFALTRSVHR